jgi:ribosome maturation factor RimP
MSVTDRVREVVLPLLTERQIDLYDVEMSGPVLRVVVDRPGGVDLDALAAATRVGSRARDEADPIAGAYTLEVTSPGLERRLRTPEHFARAVGETVKVRTVPGTPGERRVTGELVAADDEGIVVRTGVDDDGTPTERQISYDEIERARTVFDWGPGDTAGKPGRTRRGKRTTGGRSRGTSNEKRDHRS